MENTDKVTSRQLFRLAFVCAMSPVLRILPRAPLAMAGRAAWLCPIPAFAAAAVYLALVCGAVRGGTPGSSLADIALRAFGRAGGGAFLVLAALWLTVYGGFVSRAAAERLVSGVYRTGSAAFFIAATGAAVLVTSFGTVKRFARAAELFAPVMISVVLLTAAFAAKDVRAKYLLPVTFSDLGGIAAGAAPVFEVFSLGSYFLFLAGPVSDRGKARREGLRGLIWLAVCALAVSVVTVGSFAPELALKFGSAFLVVTRNVTVFGVAERIEAAVVCVLIIADFALAAASSLIAGEIMRTLTKSRSRAPFAAVSAVLGAVSALLLAESSFGLAVWSELIVPAVNLAFTLVLIPAVLVTARIRRVL